MKILARDLSFNHIGMSIPHTVHPYIQHRWGRPEGNLEYMEPRIIFAEIRMITATSKNTVKVRVSEGTDLTLLPDDEVELRELARRPAVGMLFGVVENDGDEMKLNDLWRQVVYP